MVARGKTSRPEQLSDHEFNMTSVVKRKAHIKGLKKNKVNSCMELSPPHDAKPSQALCNPHINFNSVLRWKWHYYDFLWYFIPTPE